MSTSLNDIRVDLTAAVEAICVDNTGDITECVTDPENCDAIIGSYGATVIDDDTAFFRNDSWSYGEIDGEVAYAVSWYNNPAVFGEQLAFWISCNTSATSLQPGKLSGDGLHGGPAAGYSMIDYCGEVPTPDPYASLYSTSIDLAELVNGTSTINYCEYNFLVDGEACSDNVDYACGYDIEGTPQCFDTTVSGSESCSYNVDCSSDFDYCLVPTPSYDPLTDDGAGGDDDGAGGNDEASGDGKQMKPKPKPKPKPSPGTDSGNNTISSRRLGLLPSTGVCTPVCSSDCFEISLFSEEENVQLDVSVQTTFMKYLWENIVVCLSMAVAVLGVVFVAATRNNTPRHEFSSVSNTEHGINLSVHSYRQQSGDTKDRMDRVVLESTRASRNATSLEL
eukprot:CAMPEP_0185040874 /NCGR_PEP_ID=MMETSP1103-20130426/39468_1 /TAXON_ID=36769 /ORGANISM="Paraphysomonas bandaiensis, Strain Caron Lab Isolate" /LENGTH=392 /DNA_ID=CAMNT_0027580367 /DNA_START=83 /DNA_END=1262 /DNA_ORIENTATION=+